MKAYIVTLMIVDHDELGPEEIGAVLEVTNYPNDCISPRVSEVVAYEIGEWHDGHPLNLRGVDGVGWLRQNAAKAGGQP